LVALSACATISPVLKLKKVNWRVRPVGWPVVGLNPVPGSAAKLVNVVATTGSGSSFSLHPVKAATKLAIITKDKIDLTEFMGYISLFKV